jgi:SAM-dependent methyltransferase
MIAVVPDETQARWVGSMPELYDRWLAPTVFRPFACDLARRIGGRDPGRVLEVAAGTGVLTAELVAGLPGAAVTATDLNEAMVACGNLRVPGAVWRPADAQNLPFDDGSFDVVACAFGVMFFPDKAAAFAEAGRVLRAGGSLFFTTWGTLDAHDFETAVMAALQRAFPDDSPRFFAAVPHGYADPAVIAADVEAGGLRCVSIETVTLEGHGESAAGLAMGYCTGTPVRAEIEARGDLDAAVAAVTAELEARFGSGPVAGRMTAHVVEAAPGR